MALLWIEGFEGYGTTVNVTVNSLLAQRYQALTNGNDDFRLVAGRFGGFALKNVSTYNSGGATLITPALTTNPTLVIGFAFQPAGTNNGITLCSLYDGDTQGIILKMATSGGELQVFRGGTSLGTTSGAAITANTWFYVEMKVYCHASAGTVTVNVSGVTKLSLTGQNTKAGSDAYYDRVWYGPSVTYSSYATTFDDLYILDGSGSINNDILGTRRVIGVLPSGDSSVAWTPSSGSTHYNLVNENPVDGTTTSVQSSTSGQTDLYTYQGLPPVSSITAIQINTSCRLQGAGQMSLLTPVSSGGTQSDGTSQPILTQGFADQRRLLETDPATGSPWTLSGLTAATIGIKVA